MKFPELLAARLATLGMSQSELADAMGVDRAATCRWLSGETLPSRRLMGSLLDVLRVPVEHGRESPRRAMLRAWLEAR